MRRGVQPLYLACNRAQSITCWAGIALSTIMILWLAVWLGLHLDRAGPWPWLALSGLAGLFLADLASGIVHWATDTWFDERLSERVISIAREHHLYPHHILGYGMRDSVAYAAWPTLVMIGPIGLPVTLLPDPAPGRFHAIWIMFIVSACMYFGTYAHRLGHCRSHWAVVRLLQRAGFLIDVRHHRVHHRDDHDIRYCVINGWANAVCDRLGVWRGLERVIHCLTGAEPRRNDHEWFARCQPHSPRRRGHVIGPSGPAGGAVMAAVTADDAPAAHRAPAAHPSP